ncbi:hypothetical protein AK830_g12300 [Neonectria ditissima]|uniref:Uncharacterized protein n=1 Tax=Neonectria ditissima TaxID=78410 RepID=A0A0P7B5R2_9HYPO|nr:hypothetical protein AK830_g12300 [Neonectria ditissima]
MDDEITRLKQLLAKAESNALEEQRRREEEQRRHELEDELRPLSLIAYLEACHSLGEAIQVVTDPSLTTKGEPTSPTGRVFMRDTVENHVMTLVQTVYAGEPLRNTLGIRAPPRRKAKARGKGNLADQFCVYRTSDGQHEPALTVEDKPPHKLNVNQIVTGLESEIQLERDIINKEGEGFEFAAKWLFAAVVTQLFSIYLPLHSAGRSNKVYCTPCVPELDATDEGETNLHRTAVAQTFAFVLRAIYAEPPPLVWYDIARRDLGTWAMKFDDVLSKIPATVRKQPRWPRESLYKAAPWKNFARSPIMTRSRCRPLENGLRHGDNDKDEDEDEGNGNDTSPSPTPGRARGKKESRSNGSSSRETQQEPRPQDQKDDATRKRIQDRPYCSQGCLMGLTSRGPVDKNCPNAGDHGNRHIDQQEFRRLIRAQLAIDRGENADCVPLHLSGARGSLFKVRLSSHGYVLVAKGVEEVDERLLQHESQIYDRLRPIQGRAIPVCLGVVDLELPYYYDGGDFVHFLFLSWAGRSLVF